MKHKKNRRRQKRPMRIRNPPVVSQEVSGNPGIGARAIVRWSDGIHAPPTIFPFGASDAEDQAIYQAVEEALAKGKPDARRR